MTGRYTRAALPTVGDLEPPARWSRRGANIAVEFAGQDGRSKTFRTDKIPMKQLHEAFVVAFAELTGFDGTIRTERSATGAWSNGRRFLIFLSEQQPDCESWSQITPELVQEYESHRTLCVGERSRLMELHSLHRLFERLPENERLADETILAFTRSRKWPDPIGVGGYSDATFSAMLNAARVDVRRILKRIEDGEKLLSDWKENPAALSPQDAALGEALHSIDKGMDVGPVAGRSDSWAERHRTASHLYLTYGDIPPFLVLLVALSAANSETIKELPAAHALSEGRRTVSLRLTKRRSGQGKWYQTDTWETGVGSAELARPGSLYLALHQVMDRARERCGTEFLWAVWTNGRNYGRDLNGGTHFAWSSGLAQVPLHLTRWAKSHGLKDGEEDLRVTLNRVRTSAIVRRTRELGGHLPSATKSNSQNVLFQSYLRPDATTRDWADEIIDESFADAEDILSNTTIERLDHQLIGGRGTKDSNEGGLFSETGYLACRNVSESPHDDGNACTQTALICFRCSNAVVGEKHLPGILRLRSELLERYDELEYQSWVAAYGNAWSSIQNEILPRFTTEELEQAEYRPDGSMALRYLEGRWVE